MLLVALLLRVLAAPPATPLPEFVEVAQACPAQRDHCFAIDARVVVVDGQPAHTSASWAAKIAHANALFEPLGVGFRVRSAVAIDGAWADVLTRERRDKIGRGVEMKGSIAVFLIRTLGDVDAPGQVIRGVHWRYRPNVERRWVLLSSIASKTVLAHELGHFFGLPHSGYAESIMNKRPGAKRPAWVERVFAPPELRKMRRKLAAMLHAGVLRGDLSGTGHGADESR